MDGEKSKKSIIMELRQFREAVSRKFQVEKMILFGSAATGRMHKDSDIDLIIVSPRFNGLNFFERGAKMYDYWKLRKPVDFLCYTPQEFHKLSKQISIVSEAIKEGIEIN